ncbi:class I SAM-dependent methyltransferase [Nocardia sp. CA-135953]|uniref:class I SAM-dependent methyltransferase n=1 Tax=Nocardia sp. CA-135953 TaxID=3239978 RepID=UPI003D96EFFF
MKKISTSTLPYEMYYRLGLAFWDTFDVDRGLVELIEGPTALPAGRALDLGCGTGRNSVYLARHGWRVTGVDMVEEAISKAQERARAEEVTGIRFVHADILKLDTDDIGSDFTLFVDFGCLHSVPWSARDAYAEVVTAFAAPHAVLWIWGREAFGEVGMTAEELTRRFPSWELVSAEKIPNDEMKSSVGEVPLAQRPIRAFMTSSKIPAAWRFQLVKQD